MILKIKEEDLLVYQTLSHPISCAEILFSDIDNLGEWDTERYILIRKYQFPMLAFDSLFLEDSKLSTKENFNIKNGMAESYDLGGRLTGKSIIAIIVDSLISTFNKTYKWAIISSYDASHIRGIFERIITSLENHLILKLLNTRVKRSPFYELTSDNGCLLQSVNMNVTGKNPGGHFVGRHIDKHWMEESSFITPIVSNKLLMAQSELGCINRYSGMTTFSKHSPVGKIFFNLKNQSKIINLPSYVNPTWDSKKEEDSIIEFGGKESIGYKVQIEGKVIEDADSVYDIERVRENYNHKKEIKGFEITRDNFYRFKEIIVLDRPGNVEKVFVASDIGEGSAPTEIIIIFKIGDKYYYIYNVSATRLSGDEQHELFKYIIEGVKANIVGFDTTSGMGKAIASRLTKDYPENIQWVSFNEKIRIGFELDEKGNYKTDSKGNYLYKEEYVTDWSIQRLKHLLYNQKIEIPMDYKFDLQFANIITTTSGMRTIYASKVANHVHQAFQVFSVIEWNTEFANIQPVKKRRMGLGGM